MSTGLDAAAAAARLAADRERTAAAVRLRSALSRGKVLDRLARLAGQLLDAPSAQVSLLTTTQLVAAGAGTAQAAVGSSGPLEDSLCTLTAAGGVPLIVVDAASDERVATLPPVVSGQVGSYLGVPLLSGGTIAVGAFCVYGPHERRWSDDDVALLDQLAGAVLAELELAALSTQYDSDRLRWELAIESAGIGTFESDLATGTVDCDQQMTVLLGLPAGQAELTVADAFAQVHPDDLPGLETALGGAAERLGDYSAEFRVRLPDAAPRWLTVRGRAFAAGAGPVRLLGAAQDVTTLHSARNEAARLLETMATGFVAMDAQWRITYLNAKGAALVGRRASDIVGTTLWEAFPGLDELEFGRRYREAMATGLAVDVEGFYSHLDRWFEVRAVPSPDGLGLYFTDVTARHEADQKAVQATAQISLLAEVGRVLADVGEIDDALSRLAGALTVALADWTLVTVRDEAGEFHDLGRAHRDAAMQPALDAFADALLGSLTDEAAVRVVTSTGRSIVRDDYGTVWLDRALADEATRDLVRPLQPERVLTVPVSGRSGSLGALSLVRGPGQPAFESSEIDTAEEIGRRAGVALENAHLLRAQRRLSETLQNSLLSRPRQEPGLQITARYQAAAPDAAVGGDWYDSFRLPDGATAVVVGDVSGHDQDAAAAMGQLRALLRATAYAVRKPPAAVLTALDEAMAGLAVGTLATCLLGRLERLPDVAGRSVPGRLLRWSSAGHPPAALIAPDGAVRLLAGAPDLLLGFQTDTPRADHEVVLASGSTLLLYTDGLVERRGESLDEGLDRLVRTLGELSGLGLDALCDATLRRLATRADDDVALLAVRVG